MNVIQVLFQILPLLGFVVAIAAAIYAFGLFVRFVRAQERTAAALEELARRNR